MDRVYDLLRPGADRQADRRTRAAALDIGRQRLDVVRTALMQASAAAGVRDADQRVRVVRASLPAADEAKAEGKVTFTMLQKKKP